MEIDLIVPSHVVYESIFQSAIASATEIIEEYGCKNSKKAFEKDLSYWTAWYKANKLDQKNVRKEHIILFIMQHAEEMPSHIDEELVKNCVKSSHGTHKLSTIERRISSLSHYLRLRKIDNPCQDKDIKILMKKLANKHGCSQAWGNAITLDILNQMLQTCQNDGIFGIRDAAILLFGFSTGGRRRSEISSAMLENLTKNNDGSFVYQLGVSKTNQSGENDPKPIAGRAAISLLYWINESGIKEGPIFRGIQKGGKKIIEKGLSDKQISRIVKLRCEKAGYDPTDFTAHSLRSGFVTEGGKRGKPIGDIMALTGHRSVSQVMRYYQTGDIMNNSAAYLAG